MVSSADSTVYEFDNFRIDTRKRLLWNGGSDPVALTPKVFDTLLYLVKNPGKVIEKDEIMSAIWPDTIVEENNLNKNISVLRRVLRDDPGMHRYIVTVPGRGYKFVADVQVVPDEKNLETRDNDFSDNGNAPERHRSGSIFSRKKNVIIAAGITAAIFVASFGYWYFDSPRKIDSLAVMPFLNESGDPELEYLSDGMTDTLIGSLLQLPDLNVKARSSVFRYKGKDVKTETIGNELNVRAILYGRVVQRGDDLVLHVELVDAETDNSLWNQTYNKRLSNLIALQGDVVRDLVSKLSLKLSGEDEKKLARNYTENVEAYQLFLKGQFHTRKLTRPEIVRGVEYFQQAIQADPSYALAHVGISDAYRSLGMAGEMSPEMLVRSKSAALRAIQIDDTLAEAHSALGYAVYFSDWNWAEAENQFLLALALDHNSSAANMGYADLLSRTGRREEAQAKMQRAREIEPLSPFVNTFEAGWLMAKEPDAALERVRIALEVDPNFYFAHLMAAGIYRRKEMYAESIAASQRAKALAPDQTWSDVGLAGVLFASGKRDASLAILDEMLRRSESRFVPPVHIAIVYSELGETEQALAWLEKGYEQRDPRMVFLKTEARLKNVRGEPRFAELMKKMRFPE